MSGTTTASAFWAKKSPTVLASPPSALTTTTTSPPVKSNGTSGMTEVKPRMVLKGKTSITHAKYMAHENTGKANGAVQTPKKKDWADSDGDDDFLASFSALKNPRIVSLEQQLESKDVSIEALNAVLDTKNVRIAELEDIVEHNHHFVGSLEKEVKNKDADIEKLREETQKQFLYVSELVGEVDEMGRRFEELQKELDQKCARIRELEADSESQTLVSLDDTVKTATKTENTTIDVSDSATVDKVQDNEASPQEVHAVESPVPSPAEEVSEDTSEKPASLESSADSAPTTEIAASNALEKEKPVDAAQAPSSAPELPSKQQGPAINTSMLPKMWTPEMAKRAPAVEKPKVLKMALDMSKFGKKSAPAAQKLAPSSKKHTVTATHGLSLTRRAKTDEVPKFHLHKDIREMPLAERVIFANGPEVSVNLGATTLATLPKYVLMQCSSIAYRHFTEDPDATSITFPAGSMDAEAAKTHLSWIFEMTYQGRVYSVTLNGDEKHDLQNLKICRAARILGLTNMYVGHFTKILCDRVRSRPSYQFMSQVCELAYPSNDPIFECLSNNLVNQTMGKEDAELAKDVEKLCTQYPVLKEKMVKIERRVKDSRAADKRKGRKSRDHSNDGR